MAKGFSIHNAPTNHGGIIPSTQVRSSQQGNLFIRAGDGHFCPKCKCWSTVIKSHDHVIMDGKAVAYAGDHFSCGAILMPKQVHVVGAPQHTVHAFLQQKRNLYSSTQNFVENPIPVEEHGLKFQLINKKFNIPVNGYFYLLTTNDGKEKSGFTDHDGFTKILHTGIKSEQVDLHVFDFSHPMNKWE